jgi:hypothetical protein
MRLLPSDPDVRTIVSRIESGDIDLQPDFQRGEVWSDAKKQRLIDSVLREWHVPPIHVIEVTETSRQEVLDGQQRLASIRDFVNNLVEVDGAIEPFDPEIAALDGMRYYELPDQWRRRFDQFTIRVFRIIDYRPGEPGELFYRLNQPTNLTAAEQRNAFFGPARQQVKELVQLLENLGADKDFIGFSNSRMAYDDVIARVCITLERSTLREKVTAAVLANRYRSDQPFTNDVFQSAVSAIKLFAESKQHVFERVRFNKATLYSWLYFVVHAAPVLSRESLGKFITYFESMRMFRPRSGWDALNVGMSNDLLNQLLDVYTDRATARVNDTSSVLARDIALWTLFLNFTREHQNTAIEPIQQFTDLQMALTELPQVSGEDFVTYMIQIYQWEASV